MTERHLLCVSPWWPYPADNGSRLRVFHLLRDLRERGFVIRLVAGVQEDVRESVSRGIPSELRAICPVTVPVPWVWYDPARRGPGGRFGGWLTSTPRSIAETRNPAFAEAVHRQLAFPTDAILAMEIGADAYLGTLPPGIPVILDQAEFSGPERAFRSAAGWQERLRRYATYRKGAAYWSKRLARYDLVTAVSEAEAEAVRRVAGPSVPILIVPNGTDVAAYPDRPSTERIPGQLIHPGAMTYGPNRDAVHWFAEAILPRIAARVPEAHLVVTGRYGSEDIAGLKDDRRIVLTGYLEDPKPILRRSMAAVIPLRVGGGTRLKILEAFAAQVPVVSTTIGATGLAVESGRHLLVADTEEAFANGVIRVLTDPILSAELAANGRERVSERYDWRISGGVLADALDRLCARRAD
ncbi:MAG: glycosyltransferase [Capsulimonadales bacterium]|nr:glycosyltransferase [Capsulimonadales bacterium]